MPCFTVLWCSSWWQTLRISIGIRADFAGCTGNISFGPEYLQSHRDTSVWTRKPDEVPNSVGWIGWNVRSSLPFTSEPGEFSDVRPAGNAYTITQAVFYHKFTLQISLSYTCQHLHWIGSVLGEEEDGRTMAVSQEICGAKTFNQILDTWKKCCIWKTKCCAVLISET